MDFSKETAKSLIAIGAVGFRPDDPVLFKSGILAPVYVDNRKFPFFPGAWKLVIEGFRECIQTERIQFDVIAGIEAAGIPHSSALGFLMQRPSVFVRKEAKDHGTKKRVEGGEVRGKKVLLVEDLVTMGTSSLSGVRALRAEGAVVDDCLVIVSYGFPEVVKAFTEAKVRLYALTSFPVILEEAIRASTLTENNAEVVRGWLRDPWEWTKQHSKFRNVDMSK